MKEDNGDLRELLQAWRAPEPRSDFDSRVYRRLRAEAPREPAAPWIWALRFGKPVPVGALAVALGLCVGIAIGLRAGRSEPVSTLALFEDGSLAGQYLHMLAGDAR